MGDDAVDVTIHFPANEAAEWLEGAAYRLDLVRTLRAMVGEFGALDVGSALAVAIAAIAHGKRQAAARAQEADAP